MPRNPYFRFKQFRIEQERSAMKVGVDGVLLGAWVNVSREKRMLDVGTGTGLIALMMAQKSPLAEIDAVEIDPEAFQEALFNVQQSPWSNRIHGECSSFQDFAAHSKQKYDLIISNPPFFVNSLKASEDNRAKARHADALPLTELISGAKKILTENGKIALVLPAESLQELGKMVVEQQLFISRLCRVKPNPVKPVFRILVEIASMEIPFQEEELMIEFEQHHDYTPQYRELTKDFYLKF